MNDAIAPRYPDFQKNYHFSLLAMAATASIGAIWSSTSPDFGVSGVLDRFQQINPKLIFSVEAVSYNMKVHNHLDKLRQVVNGIGDSLEKVIIVPFCNTKNLHEIQLKGKEILVKSFIDMAKGNSTIEYEQVSVNTSRLLQRNIFDVLEFHKSFCFLKILFFIHF